MNRHLFTPPWEKPCNTHTCTSGGKLCKSLLFLATVKIKISVQSVTRQPKRSGDSAVSALTSSPRLKTLLNSCYHPSVSHVSVWGGVLPLTSSHTSLLNEVKQSPRDPEEEKDKPSASMSLFPWSHFTLCLGSLSWTQLLKKPVSVAISSIWFS